MLPWMKMFSPLFMFGMGFLGVSIGKPILVALGAPEGPLPMDEIGTLPLLGQITVYFCLAWMAASFFSIIVGFIGASELGKKK